MTVVATAISSDSSSDSTVVATDFQNNPPGENTVDDESTDS